MLGLGREAIGPLPEFLVDFLVGLFHFVFCVDTVRRVHDFVAVFPQIEAHEPQFSIRRDAQREPERRSLGRER